MKNGQHFDQCHATVRLEKSCKFPLPNTSPSHHAMMLLRSQSHPPCPLPSPHPKQPSSSTKPRLLILNRNLLAGSTLILPPNEIRDLLILCLLNCRSILRHFLLFSFSSLRELTRCLVGLVLEPFPGRNRQPCQLHLRSSRFPFRHRLRSSVYRIDR